MTSIVKGPDGQPRCGWCGSVPELFAYHDNEWGYPVADDVRLFEKLCLESFQSGLSWRTILAKRDNFRAAFAGFDFKRMAEFGESDKARQTKSQARLTLKKERQQLQTERERHEQRAAKGRAKARKGDMPKVLLDARKERSDGRGV